MKTLDRLQKKIAAALTTLALLALLTGAAAARFLPDSYCFQ